LESFFVVLSRNKVTSVKSRNKVTSVNNLGFGEITEFMVKLNQRKIRWIIRELKRGELSAYRIARQQGISKTHLWRIFHRFRDDKKPKLLLPGRKPKPISKEEVETVKNLKEETGLGAVNIEKILSERGERLPHNRIHFILRREGLAREQPNKSRRRKWIRYERKHSNSLWHADWFEFEGRQYILYEDDASRLVTGAGEFQNATTENSIRIYDEATSNWGIPKQLMTDHGIQFCSDEEKEFAFRNHLEVKGTEHIMARVKHPQSNGKLERLVFTIKRLIEWKGSLAEAVKFYNEKRPHMSLENGHLRTPLQAFYEKLRGAA
jgi:putative transposase